jgi:hypothetical protein
VRSCPAIRASTTTIFAAHATLSRHARMRVLLVGVTTTTAERGPRHRREHLRARPQDRCRRRARLMTAVRDGQRSRWIGAVEDRLRAAEVGP